MKQILKLLILSIFVLNTCSLYSVRQSKKRSKKPIKTTQVTTDSKADKVVTEEKTKTAVAEKKSLVDTQQPISDKKTLGQNKVLDDKKALIHKTLLEKFPEVKDLIKERKKFEIRLNELDKEKEVSATKISKKIPKRVKRIQPKVRTTSEIDADISKNQQEYDKIDASIKGKVKEAIEIVNKGAKK